MYLTFQYPCYAYHESSAMSSFKLNYTYSYTKHYTDLHISLKKRNSKHKA